ncbi:phospholipase D family protein [Flavobacterium sp. RNTU_13]|uniref:phospholipase D family protein n=1 Tax=Flavobacterium sp. RNTU_13 TaxID=3375145 RepID=UPI003986B4E8
MSKFLTGAALIDTIDSIIWDAEKVLLIVSPFIKLDDYFKKLFEKHINKPEIHIIIVFGKNENDVKRSFSKDDFDYFKRFPNISIIYAANLHAKYYGNESKGLITSINLYDASFKNNIEFGVYSEQTLINSFTDHFVGNPDWDAWTSCKEIANNNDVVFVKRPVYQGKKLIINIGKTYIKSEILVDNTEYFYNGNSTGYKSRRLSEFKDELDVEDIKPSREDYSKPVGDLAQFQEPKPKYKEILYSGYCIRTGVSIPFNPDRPLSHQAWTIWSQWNNYDFPENFCHKTGKPSNGKTSMRNPILYNF